MPSSGTTPKRRLLICLTGFMGSGKTTVGQLLARQLAWRFVDLDTRVEEQSGRRIAEIFEHLGEDAFRAMEHKQLLEILGEIEERDQPTVLALGGGTLAQPGNLDILRSFCLPERPSARGSRGVVLWLDCPVEDLLARCVTMTNRPLFRDEASFRTLYKQRLPFYQQADHRVESKAAPLRVVEQILAIDALEQSLPTASSKGPVSA